MEKLLLTLPWPPSLNGYFTSIHGRLVLSKKGRHYRQAVCEINHGSKPLTGRLVVKILACPPDRRRRDLDNLLKSTLDALTHARVMEDDSQIDELQIVRGQVVRDGVLQVSIHAL